MKKNKKIKNHEFESYNCHLAPNLQRKDKTFVNLQKST